MQLEARTHRIALHPTWDSVVQLTTCPLLTDSQREPFQIQAIVSDLQLASPNNSELILYEDFPPEESYTFAQWPKEPSRVTKLLTFVRQCLCFIVWCIFGIIAMFCFESLLKRKERAENLDVLSRLCHRVRPWGPVLPLPGPQSHHQVRGWTT